jgi:hypothetical protein
MPLLLRKKIEKRLSYLGTLFINHILLQPKEEIEQFLAAEKTIFEHRLKDASNPNARLLTLPQETINQVLKETVGCFGSLLASRHTKLLSATQTEQNHLSPAP